MTRRTLILALWLVGTLFFFRWLYQTTLNFQLLQAVCNTHPRDPNRIRALLARGADPNTVDNKKVRVLSWASAAGDTKTMTYLLDAGADPSCRGGWLPALEMATGRERVEAVQLLLSRGADPNGENGWSPALCLAASRANPRLTRILLDAGANPNSANWQGKTALQLSGPATRKLLLKAGAR